VRTAQLQCSNVECGHTFGAQLAITHTIAPSLCPNPEIALPIAPPRLKPSNDNLSAPPRPPIESAPQAAFAAG
jgi:hypothetical protein